MRSKRYKAPIWIIVYSHACAHAHTNPYVIHSDRATLNNMHASPVLASPLSLHSREQMFGDSLQPQRISVYKANSSTQHFWLQWEMCSWSGGRGGLWVTVRYHENGWRGKKSEKEGTHRGETVSRLQVGCIGKSPISRDLCCCCVEVLQGSILAVSPVWHHREN